VDYDDAVFHNYDLSGNPFKRFMADKIDRVMRQAALVTCGNSYIAERARAAGSRRVEIVPTVIDLERYSIAAPEKNIPLVIGWIGSPSTVKYLETVAITLKELAAECPLELRVVGAQFSLPGLDVVCVPWSEATEVNEIQKIDIGIMPLVDSPWERGKCGYKLVQYMACGLPVVASPVGVNEEIVTHGVNGYLARTSDDWLNAFRMLCADAESRRKMGALGRLSVEQKYCLQVMAPQVARLFHEVLDQR
jgi:glycosyltransferase involved in cell wall biosynthesis